MDDIGVCVICGKEFVRGKHQSVMKYCSTECHRIVARANSKRFRELNREKVNQRNRERKREKRRKGKTNSNNSEAKMSAAEIEILAWKEGLSYGKYVAKYGV